MPIVPNNHLMAAAESRDGEAWKGARVYGGLLKGRESPNLYLRLKEAFNPDAQH